MSSTINRIRSFEKIPPNLEYDAVTKAAIEKAIEVHNALPKGIGDRVFPMRDGGVQFDIDVIDDEFNILTCIEIEVSPKGVVTILHYNSNYDIVKEERNATIENVSKLSY